ncbi:hypothetical protein [Oleispirillum naphthae]|uniref:hypothetical protein n=1 Tax=Oleispirillum naphthae TaxID=2838853 RepID=UPI0030822CDD
MPFFSPFRRGLLLGLFAALALAACTSTPPAPTYPDIRFSQGEALPIRAMRVDISSSYQPTFASPNVEHLMPVSPERMARQWALDRLQPLRAGRAVARFEVLDARVTETRLKVKTGIVGTFTDEPAERYDATLTARLTLDDPERSYHGSVETTASRSLTVQEGASINDREKAWYELTKKLGEEFDRAMSANIKRYLPEALGN